VATAGGRVSDKNLEQRINMKFCVKTCKRVNKTLAVLTLAYIKYDIKKLSVSECHRKFRKK
jgi:hypothetical protein